MIESNSAWKIGLSAFAWTRSIEAVDPAMFAFVREAGFAVLEIPMFAPRDLPVAELRKAFEANALGCTVCCILPPSVNPISPEAAVRRQARAHLVQCVQTAAEMECQVLGGPMFAPIGYLPGHRPNAEEREWAAEAFSPLGDMLDAANMTLSIEPVNRSETFFLRTAEEAAALVDAIGHPRIGVTVDMFHANIEEKSIPAAIRGLGARLRHIHASENDRGVLGSGHIDFKEMCGALREVGYSGYVVVEGFGYSGDHTDAPGTLWADKRVSPEDLARKSIQFLQGLSPA